MIRYYLIPFLLLACMACHTFTNLSITELQTSAETASKNGDWLKAAQLYEQIYQQNPRNEKMNYEAGTNYLKANLPQKALALFNSFNPIYQDTTAEFNGRMARIAKGYYQIGDYQAILKVVDQYHYPKMYRGLAREHLKALIQLNAVEPLVDALLNYQKKGIFDDKGKQTNTGFLYRAICNELLLTEEKELLSLYAKIYADWAQLRPVKDQRNRAISAFYHFHYDQSISLLHKAIAIEKSPRHLLELEGLLGICYAKKGAIIKAKAQLEKIRTFPTLPPRHDAFGAKWYHQARIQVALDQPIKAIQSLEKALAENAEFWSNKFKEDGLLKRLLEVTEFKALVAP